MNTYICIMWNIFSPYAANYLWPDRLACNDYGKKIRALCEANAFSPLKLYCLHYAELHSGIFLVVHDSDMVRILEKPLSEVVAKCAPKNGGSY